MNIWTIRGLRIAREMRLTFERVIHYRTETIAVMSEVVGGRFVFSPTRGKMVFAPVLRYHEVTLN